jgi:tetratricopeptide (TPR) repeat protein
MSGQVRFLLSGSFILLLSFAPLFSTGLKDELFDSEINRGMESLLTQNFDTALGIATSMVRKMPTHPAGYFLRTACYAAMYYDQSDVSFVGKMTSSVNKITELTEKSTKPVYRLYRGAAFAYYSIVLAKEDRWFAGALYGKKSSEIFRKMMTNGVRSPDVSGMLGGYYYWTSAFIHRFSWLPFVEDRREEGIRLLKEALPNSRYIRFAILNSLLWIYYDNGEYGKALSLCDDVLLRYPGHRIFRQARMHILFKMQRYEDSKAVADSLICDWSGKEKIPVNLLNIRIKLVLLHFSMGKRDAALLLAKDIAKYRKDRYIRVRL